jgi:hypothetical protein
MKKITVFLLAISTCFCLTSCSGIEGLIKKIPLFEEADVDALTDKAEKAWNEVGKDALKDAAADATDTIFGKEEKLSWPQTETMKNIPPVSSGTISKINDNGTISEITIKEISLSGYEEYTSLLTQDLGEPISSGIYRLENRLMSAIYDDETSTLVITVSIIKQKAENTSDTSEDEVDNTLSEESENV